MKNVAVTGCSGFVGGAIALELHKRGYTVRGGYRDRQPAVPYETLQGDLCEPATAGQLIEGCDTVFHAAALVGTLNYKQQHPATVASVNLRTTLNVFDACIHANVQHCVFLSSTEIYCQSGMAIEENGFLGNPDSRNDGYVWSKRYGEITLALYARQFGLKWSAIRLDNIYGPGEQYGAKPLRAIPTMIDNALAGADLVVWGDGSQERSFLYIDDAVDGIIASAGDVENGPINLSGTERISIQGLATLIAELTGARAGIIKDGSRPSGPPVREISIEKARKVLGFSPKVDLREGIKRCVASFAPSRALPPSSQENLA